MRLVWLFLSLLLSACATGIGTMDAIVPLFKCQANASSTKLPTGIVGGQDVGFSDPDQKLVTLLKIRRNGANSICTGSLLRDRIVLTAAHCVDGADATEITAVFMTDEGCPLLSQRLVEREASEVAVIEGFDGSPQSYSDVALIKLAKDAPKDQQRLKLVGEGDEYADELILLGYGITDEKRKDAETLRRVLKPKSQISVREKIVVIDQRPGTGFCRGDSGAPLIASVWTEPKILSVNSATVGTETNEECHTMSIGMNVRYFENWITTTSDRLSERSFFQRAREAVGL